MPKDYRVFPKIPHIAKILTIHSPPYDKSILAQILKFVKKKIKKIWEVYHKILVCQEKYWGKFGKIYK